MNVSSPEPTAQAFPDILVRDVRGADMETIQGIYSHHVLHGYSSFEEVPPDRDELSARCAEILKRGLPYIVAERRGEIVGYAYAGQYRVRSAYRYTIEDSVYVDRNSLRQGIGRTLLRVLIERCRTLGYRQMIAVIGDAGQSSSVAAHMAMGFEQVGRLPSIGYKLGRWVDIVLMQRALGPGGTTPPEP
ncbi:MAG TPA: GNAT family N-acetyltransferase [Alphaproteobacteria bacterium]|nr:GNAT family N-acetyltransferase [Alphaproteobacteria bacterium]